MSGIDYTDDRKCINCEHAKYKETTRDGIEVYFCGLHRKYITIHTLAQFGCRGKDYKSRVKEKRKPEPKEKPTDGQMTIDEWLQEIKA